MYCARLALSALSTLSFAKGLPATPHSPRERKWWSGGMLTGTLTFLQTLFHGRHQPLHSGVQTAKCSCAQLSGAHCYALGTPNAPCCMRISISGNATAAVSDLMTSRRKSSCAVSRVTRSVCVVPWSGTAPPPVQFTHAPREPNGTHAQHEATSLSLSHSTRRTFDFNVLEAALIT